MRERKYQGGEKVVISKRTKKAWTVCKSGHGYNDGRHLFYKLYRGKLVTYRRTDHMITT